MTMWAIAWDILCDTAIYILIGFAIAGLLTTWLSGSRALNWLSRRGPRSVVLATLVGAPLPLCSCSVLPSAVTLRKAGASRGATLAFLISTPETSVTSILLTYALLGPLLAIFRPLAACVTAIAAGLLDNLVERRAARGGDGAKFAAAPDAAAPASPGALPGAEAAGAGRRFAAGMRYAFVDLFDDIFHWVLIGILVAAAIQRLAPPELFSAYFGNPWLAMLLMLVIGIPLYICAESSTPVAAALIAKGLNPGAALVLLLAGPATNIGAIGVLLRELGRRTVTVYLATIAVVAVLLGALFNLLLTWFPPAGALRTFDEPLLPAWLKTLGAVAFLALGLLTAQRRRYGRRAVAWLDARLPVRVTAPRLVVSTAVIGLLAYLASGCFTVQPGEVGIVRRFGAIVRADLPPGLYYAWPWPVETADRVPVGRVERLVLGFKAGSASGQLETDIDQAWTLVGDENIADLKAAVHWGVDRAQVVRFRYGVADHERLVRSTAVGAIREVLGGRRINRGFTTERRECQTRIEELIRQRLAAYGSGIRVDCFHFLDAHAPPEVHDAFRDIASALEDKSTQINLALAQEARVVPLARGEAEQMLAQAAGYAATTLAAARGEAARFADLLAVQRDWPLVTCRRLYFEMLERVLPGVRKYIRATGAALGELEIWLVNPRIGGGLPWQAGGEMR